jgi:hypothetical protein
VPRRGAGVVERGSLENRWPSQGGSWVRIPPPPLCRAGVASRRDCRGKNRARKPPTAGSCCSTRSRGERRRFRLHILKRGLSTQQGRPTDCGLAGRSRDPAHSQRTPKIPQHPRRRRRPARSRGGRRTVAGNPRLRASTRARCLPDDGDRERRADTCCLAIRPTQRSGPRRLPRPAPRPGGRQASRRPGAQHQRGGRTCSHVRSEPVPTDPTRPPHRPAGIDVR